MGEGGIIEQAQLALEVGEEGERPGEKTPAPAGAEEGR